MNVPQRWKQTKYPSTNEWINKMWYTHSLEYYSVIRKRNKVLIHDAIWMYLENIMLSERSQKKKRRKEK